MIVPRTLGDEGARDDLIGAAWAEDAEAIHQWYRIIMGFDWKLADFIIDSLSVREGQTVLDPFCGAGTTLVQCKKRGIDTIGLDVNPVCTLATTVKTTWTLDPSSLRRTLDRILTAAREAEDDAAMSAGSALVYLKDSGMIDRGWLTLHKARKVMALRASIRNTAMSQAYKQFFHLALVSAVVSRIADIKFGPEVYCLPQPRKLPVITSFVEVAETMIEDMKYARGLKRNTTSAKVYLGDSRSVDVLTAAAPGGADFAITSPPYPNEHDYTRSTRLELVFLDHVSDLAGLRKIKKQMVRCTTKGIYKDDAESECSAGYTAVDQVARELDARALNRGDGFSRLYGRMVREYFGGMANHLRGVAQILKPGGRCAYVVRDSQSLGVYVDTPAILAEIAASERQGLEVQELIEWKRIKGTTGVRTLSEKIVMLRKPRR
jgi:DNA modification methylase